MRVCILCIGNRDGGDDAVGPFIADHLDSTEDRKIIDAGTVPENFTGVIKEIKPDKLIIIDAVDMGLSPGEIRVVPKEKIGSMHISTHGIPVSVFIQYLEQYLRSILFIGIQPKTMDGSLTSELQAAGIRLIKKIEQNTYDSILIL